ncbi:isochorismatase family protein [Paenibacillus sp. CMAA1739]|uniref:isochorismatase family protein n=1 Tax=Paenibacillus ottowii TaxID=2315729 RepID=UPI0027309197|nr:MULTISPECIES: isochorismatase family protein [Paenibacillus]MDP1510675.1 isochorismatase family protein [Paenibacillus ottowii]MEC4566093.1 isochorismatase family protein [Paenibacillus sp. CMAA1739]
MNQLSGNHLKGGERAPLLDWNKTSLVVIDLQNWISSQYAPYSAEMVIANSAKLANLFRNKGAFVNLVHVSSKDFKDIPSPKLDITAPRLNLIEGWDEFVPELGVTETDHIISKKQWGAFHGTDLDLQLRRRNIDTIVLCGISSGIGVDTTAREAFQHGYQLIFAIDAMTGFTKAEHEHVRDVIFPRIGRIRTTEEILEGI